jgi:hypothetical protein
LAEAGGDVLAVELDSRVAAAKCIRVEQATFEDWQPTDGRFDLVVFTQPFHWVDPRPALRKGDGDGRESGFSLERRRCLEKMHFTTEDYLNLVFNYSTHLLLDAETQAESRSRLAACIGSARVVAKNDSLAIVCTPTSPR